jgi:L-fucose isomerase-like protein
LQTINKIGVVTFARKRPGFDQEWSKVVRAEALRLLAQQGYEIVGGEETVVDDQTVSAAVDKIAAAGCAALIVLQPSIADGQFVFTILQRWSGPLILWTTPERPGDGKVSSCGLTGQNLFASILRQAGRSFELIYGIPNASLENSIPEVNRAIAVSRAVMALRRSKVGLIGAHVPGFVDLAADGFLIYRTFGMQLHTLSLVQFIERVHAMPAERVRAEIAKTSALGLPQTDPGREVDAEAFLDNTARFYLAIREMLAEFSLDAAAVQCWPELPNTVGHWPYLAVSRLSSEGEALSIEGDVDGAISALIGLQLGAGTGFLTDWLEHDDKSIFFWHPGMAPLDMCNEPGCDDGPSIGDHFNNVRPMVVDGPIRTGGPVTVTRLWRCDGRYHLTAFEGRAIPPRRKLTGNTLLVEFPEGGIAERFQKLAQAGMPHHVTVHFGSHAESLRRFAGIINLEWHV